MKQLLKKIVRATASWPIIGRLIRINVAIVRLPEMLTSLLHFRAFASEQLPTILHSLSELNQRQLICQQQLIVCQQQLIDSEKLFKSIPVALRTLTRDLIDTRSQLDKINMTNVYGQVENLMTSIQYLSGRVEFVRRELMFELHSNAPNGGGSLEVATKILAPEKLETARNQQIKLNLGCGHIPLDGYLNVDQRELPGVDIVAETQTLPFEKEEVHEIFSAHFLEHFPQEQLCRELLPYFFDLLKPGGRFHAVVPDARAMIQEYTNGQLPYEDFREVMYGTQEYSGNFHYNMFTPDSLTQLLESAGFDKVSIVESGRKNGQCFEFEVTAEKP
jgi:predicted SAM-dependent methyltransferase